VFASILLKISEKLYIRDPENTELGRKIVEQSILLIDEIGFEHFTFKKLAASIGSTEASVYRYFENKHKLLIYLVSWYWSWVDYLIDFQTNNIDDPERKLKIIIKVLTESGRNDPASLHINEETLHRIVIAESAKLYLTKQVDADNKEGLFRAYKSLCHKISKIVLEYNPGYNYPHTLVSTLIETAHEQMFFSHHLPSLTEIRSTTQDDTIELVAYLEHMVFSMLNKQ
jgi:AcrR family transcriptional regulator